MGGESKSSQTTSQQATRDPWAPTVDPLKGVIGQLNGQLGNTGPTGTEQGAFNTLTQNAQAGNPYASQIGGFASNMLNGGGANAQAPQVQGAYDQYKSQIMPWANGSMGDPNTNPALRSMLDTIQSDVGNSVNSQFAAAGRDMSGANQMAYGRGIAQGFAPTLMAAQQQGLQSAGDLYNAGNNTSGILSGMNQQGLQNQGQGIDASTAALQARDSGANQLLNIGQQQRNLPIANVGNIASLLTPIAQLGGNTSGTGQTNGTQQMSPVQQAMGWGQAAGSMFGGQNSAANGILKFFSDIRLKQDVQQVGMMFDGTPIYRYRYLNDPRMTIGLMAHDVERYAPGAVEEINGFKAVDYAEATDRAVAMGGA